MHNRTIQRFIICISLMVGTLSEIGNADSPWQIKERQYGKRTAQQFATKGRVQTLRYGAYDPIIGYLDSDSDDPNWFYREVASKTTIGKIAYIIISIICVFVFVYYVRGFIYEEYYPTTPYRKAVITAILILVTLFFLYGVYEMVMTGGSRS
jgi:hypothetical protein